MTYKTILTNSANKIFTITLNRPKKLNALSPTVLAEMKAALGVAEKDDAVSVVVIKSAGRVFCAGYDLSEEDWIISQFPADYPAGVDFEQDRKDIHGLLDYWLNMWTFPKPIIVQVQGACLSGAGELLAVSDIVIASEEATFGHPAGRDLGIPPTVFLWPILIGMRKTKEMLYTARSMSAAEAESLGLINQVVPAEKLGEAVKAMATDIVKTPGNHLMILKEATNNWYDNMGLTQSSKQAADLDAHFHQSPTFQAFFNLVREKGMKAALAERKKRFG